MYRICGIHTDDLFVFRIAWNGAAALHDDGGVQIVRKNTFGFLGEIIDRGYRKW